MEDCCFSWIVRSKGMGKRTEELQKAGIGLRERVGWVSWRLLEKFLIFPRAFIAGTHAMKKFHTHLHRSRSYLCGFPLSASVASNVDAESSHTSKTLPSSKLRALPAPGPFKTPADAEFSLNSLPRETMSVIRITLCFWLVCPDPVACAPFSNNTFPELVTGSSNVAWNWKLPSRSGATESRLSQMRVPAGS